MLFALGESHELGAQVAAALGGPLAPLEERDFEDGEHKTRPLASVRDRDVYVLHALHGHGAHSPGEKLVRLLFCVGALKDAGARRVTAVTPYLAYARKDRRTQPRDPVNTRYVAQLAEAVGVDRVVALDVHNIAAFQNAFRCPAENLEAAPLLVRHVAPFVRERPVVVVSPDSGGVKRAEAFRRRLSEAQGRPIALAFAEKHRSGGIVSGEALVGDVAGAVALIVDDLISTGTTMARAALACRAHGATEVHAIATHAQLAEGANDTLSGGAIDRIVVTDSVPVVHARVAALVSRLERVGIAGLLADAIGRLHAGRPLSELAP